MDSILELLVKKKHPEYTEEEVWEESWQFCEKNACKIRIFLKHYLFDSVTEPFDRLRKQTMSVIHNSDNLEMQRMLRDITNFETGLLFLLADEAARERLTRNLTKRLETIVGGEAYIAARKLSPGEKEFEAVLGKVMRVFFSEDMLEFKRKRWECRQHMIFHGREKDVYRFTHELSTFPELDEVKMDGDTLEEVTEEELLRFCRSIYGRQYDV